MYDDRRGALREPFSQPVTIRVEHEGETCTLQAQVVDISASGARIRTLAELEPGDPVEFVPADNPEHPARYLVAWTGRQGSDLEGEIGLSVVTAVADSAPESQ